MTQPKTSPLEAATTKAALPLMNTTLIGLYQTPKGASALIRRPNGKIEKIIPGDRLEGAIVVAIDDKGLVLDRAGTSRRLAMP